MIAPYSSINKENDAGDTMKETLGMTILSLLVISILAINIGPANGQIKEVSISKEMFDKVNYTSEYVGKSEVGDSYEISRDAVLNRTDDSLPSVTSENSTDDDGHEIDPSARYGIGLTILSFFVFNLLMAVALRRIKD